MVIEDDGLHQLEKDKFSVLNEAKKINVGNNIPVTLSIGIASYNDSVEENFNAAASALELALDRGGDQAIVRIDNKDTFYGASDIELESLNKVKSRLTADLLKKEILASKKVFIVGHKFPDMDALGSALAIYRLNCLHRIFVNTMYLVLLLYNLSIFLQPLHLLQVPLLSILYLLHVIEHFLLLCYYCFQLHLY